MRLFFLADFSPLQDFATNTRATGLPCTQPSSASGGTRTHDMALSMASNAHLNLTACRKAARSSLTDGAALADCVFPASFSDRRSDEATVGRWLKLGKNNLDFHALPTSARIEQPFVEQWHLVTQNILFRHLRQLWADDRPRVMVDIGCHAVCRVHMCYACASNAPRKCVYSAAHICLACAPYRAIRTTRI